MNLYVSLQKEGNIFLAGNHEFVLRMALNTHHPQWEYWLGRWAVGHEDGTLQSYGVKRPSKYFYDDKSTWERAIVELWWAMPDSHRDFLFGLPLFYETSEQIFIHAGLNLQSWHEQKLFLQGGDHGARGPEQVFSHKLAQALVHGASKVVVSGHQHFKEPIRANKRLLLHCGVDYGGPLVAWVSDLDRFILPLTKKK